MKKLISYFRITLGLNHMTISEEVTLGITGLNYDADPDYTDPSVTQAQLKVLAETVQTDLGSRINSPTIVLTAKEQKDVDALSRGIVTVKSEVEIVGNNKAQGNRAIFEQIARRIGFHPSAPHGKHVRIAEFLPSEKGFFHFRVPSEGTKIIYNFKYGIVIKEGDQPAIWILVPLDVADIIMGGFPSGTIIAMYYAAQKTPSTRKPVTPAAVSTEKVASKKITTPSGVLTILPANKHGKVTLMHGVEYLHYSDIFYYQIP